MAVIKGNRVLPGVTPRQPAQVNGVPDANTFVGTAYKGFMVVNTATGIVYVNTGTAAVPAWSVVGSQT